MLDSPEHDDDNVVLRMNYEASMLTIEAIEVHLQALHKGQDELRKDVREAARGQQ